MRLHSLATNAIECEGDPSETPTEGLLLKFPRKQLEARQPLGSLPEQTNSVGLSEADRTLFSYYGIKLQRHLAPSRYQYGLDAYLRIITEVKNGRGRLVVVSRNQVSETVEHHFQFPFPFFVDFSDSNVRRVLPRSRYPYLDYGVYDVFRDNKEIGRIALQLEERGIFYLGHLVQRTEADLLKFPFVTQDAVRAIQEQLTSMGLGLGVSVPSWQRAYDKEFGR